jgi:hypothetical protein
MDECRNDEVDEIDLFEVKWALVLSKNTEA